MTQSIQPWQDFSALTASLASLHDRAHVAAVRSVDELLTLRNWLTGMWIVGYQEEGKDRARYGEGLIDALAAEFKAQGLRGFSKTNLRKYREIAMAWPCLAIQLTVSVELLLPDGVPTFQAQKSSEALSWQDDAWMTRLRTELSWSHFLELVRVQDDCGGACGRLGQRAMAGHHARQLLQADPRREDASHDSGGGF